MSRLVMKETTWEMYIGVCLQCPSTKFIGNNPAIASMDTPAILPTSASNDAREHVRETGHTVRGVMRIESVWRPTIED